VRFERFCGFVAWSLPVGAALARASSLAQWRGDVGAVRDLALAATGWGGGASAVATQVTALLPVGSLSFRAALVSLVALGVFGATLHRVALGVLRAVETGFGLRPSRYAAPAFAMIGSLLTGLGSTLQLEATTGGSSLLGAALALAVVARLGGGPQSQVSRPAVRATETALLVGLAASENVLATMVALGAGLSWAWGRGPSLPLRVQRLTVGLAGAGLLVGSSTAIVRTLTPFAPMDLGGPFLWGPALPTAAVRVPPPLAAFVAESGWLCGIGACLGLLLVLAASVTSEGARPGAGRMPVTLDASRHARGFLRAVVALAISDALLLGAVGPTEGVVALRALTLGALGAVAVAGAFGALALLVKKRVPFARAGAALVVALHLTVLSLVFEQATFVADREAQVGADLFTEVALDRLPARAAVVVDDPRITWRMMAAQLVEGRREDVLVLPTRLLDRGTVAARALASEPSAEAFVRSTALTGSADEYALTELADARALHLVPNPGWDSSVYDHLSPSGAWLEFDSEPKSPLERSFDAEATLRQVSRLAPIVAAPRCDPATHDVVQAVATAQSKLLLRVGQLDVALAYVAKMNVGRATSVTRSLDVLFAGTVARLPSSIEQQQRQQRRVAVKPKKPKHEAPPLFRKPPRAAAEEPVTRRPARGTP
jgi:hypothetical protein